MQVMGAVEMMLCCLTCIIQMTEMVVVRFAQSTSFNSANHVINFSHDNAKKTTTLIIKQRNLTTDGEARTSDIALFHEMLHWLHWLRNSAKQNDNKSHNPKSFRYAMRCYYGDPSDLCAWGNINAEEIATILGSPNLNRNPHPYTTIQGQDLINYEAFSLRGLPNNGSIMVQINGINRYIPKRYQFLNGDDLSENAYRASRGQPMRFGHATVPVYLAPLPNNDINRIPDRFRLAHKVAYDCYHEITGNPPPNWDLVQGQAIR